MSGGGLALLGMPNSERLDILSVKCSTKDKARRLESRVQRIGPIETKVEILIQQSVTNIMPNSTFQCRARRGN